MFSKAKIKRFNEEVGCAPPPTKYDANLQKDSKGCSFNKTNRWNELKKDVPSPTAYQSVDIKNSPIKLSRRNTSSSLNSSTISNESSNSVFLSPAPYALSRSKSARSFKFRPKSLHLSNKEELETELAKIFEERDALKNTVYKLQEKIQEIEKVNESNSSLTKCTKDSFIQVDFDSSDLDKQKSFSTSYLVELEKARERICSLEDANSQLICKVNVLEKTMSEEDALLQKERLNHLTGLRDNLEESILKKDDLIAELQLQLDQIVVEAREHQDRVQKWKNEATDAQEKLKIAEQEKHKVQSLVAHYEKLFQQHDESDKQSKELIDKKDIEIGLLNESVASLSRLLQEEGADKEKTNSKISSLEITVSELSMVAKEKEVVETMCQDELKQREQEIIRLEHNLEEVETKMDEVLKDRDSLIDALEEEKLRSDEMNEKIEDLQRTLKEREVVQQFLEKEVASREAELAESSGRINGLECDLETARQIALDLQQEAEKKLNELLGLKAELSVKDYDLDARDETINSLKEEISGKTNITIQLQSKIESEYVSRKDLEKREEFVIDLECRLSEAQEAQKVAEENTGQLEEKIVDLMSEISDRDTEYGNKIRELESELEELSVKYSDSLLEHEATRRALNLVSDELKREKLLLKATEDELEQTKNKFKKEEDLRVQLDCKYTEVSNKVSELQEAITIIEEERNEFAILLQENQELLKLEINNAKVEKDTLISSNTGFMSQITQLKIDIRKKSQAVDDMKDCIETLREEKIHLTSLRDNLENTLENKEENIIQLRNNLAEAETRSIEDKKLYEEEISKLTCHVSSLDNHLREETVINDQLKEQITKFEEEKDSMSNEHKESIENFEELIEEFKRQETKFKDVIEKLTSQEKKYVKDINELEHNINEKTSEIVSLKEQLTNANETLGSRIDELDGVAEQLSKLKLETTTLSKSLEEKDTLVSSLNVTLSAKSEQIVNLYKSLEDKQTSLIALEEKVENLTEAEEQLATERDKALFELSTLHDNYNTTKDKLNQLETSIRDETASEISKVVSEHDAELSLLKDKNSSLSEELLSWKSKYEQLEEMIEPFREQLDAYEIEKLNLMSSSTAAKDQLQKLSTQYAKLLGHNNHKQKIHHLMKLKNENVLLKEQVQNLRLECDRQKRTAKRLEEKLQKQGGKSKLNETKILSDKENISNISEIKSANLPKESLSISSVEPLTSTPAKSLKKPQRL